MPRSRRNSLVQSIASNPVGSNDRYSINDVLDDTYLVNKLHKLSLIVDKNKQDFLQENSNDTAANAGIGSIYSSSSGPENGSKKIKSNGDNDNYQNYYDYIGNLNVKLEDYNKVYSKSQVINSNFNKILVQFDQISSSSNKFINDTNKLFEKHHELNNLADSIPKILNYFDSLDLVMRRLNHANSTNIVKRDSFKSLLSTIDQSLFFLQDNPDLLDSESYRIKFKQCLIRAMTLIANYNNNLLKLMFNEITSSKNQKLINNSNTRDALLYNKFSSISDSYNEQIMEIVSRTYNNSNINNNNNNSENNTNNNSNRFVKYHDELKSIMNDCFNNYFQIRNKLLFNMIWSQLDDLFTKQQEANSDFVSLIQSMKSYFQQLCLNEYNLAIKFFPLQDNNQEYTNKIIKRSINSWLLKLCEPLYTTITNRILQQNDINQLCDAIILFQPLYEFEEGSEEYLKQFNQIHFDKIFDPIVNKVQDQLFNTVKLSINDNLINYEPTINDLMISNKLHDIKYQNDPNGVNPIFQNYLDNLVIRLNNSFARRNNHSNFYSREIVLSTYYTPLLKSMAILFKLYDVLINTTLFDELSHFIVHNCIVSLRKSYDLFVDHSNTLDIKLSVLNNLLLLRDEIQNFNIQSNTGESSSSINFSPVNTLINSLKWSNGLIFSIAKGLATKGRSASNISISATDLNNGTSKSNNGNELDSRIELIHELRKIIKDFTDSASNEIINNSLIITDNVNSEILFQNNVNLRNGIEDNIPKINHKIMDLIHDNDITLHLLKAIKDMVVNQYSSYYNKVNDMANKGEISKDVLNDILFIDVLEEMFNNIFNKLDKAGINAGTLSSDINEKSISPTEIPNGNEIDQNR